MGAVPARFDRALDRRRAHPVYGDEAIAPPASPLEQALAAPLVAMVREAIERAEARGEERARARRTHYSVAEAAEALGISPTHCRRMIDEGVVPSLRLGERVVVPRVALERLGVDR